jgi:hypothetical protein
MLTALGHTRNPARTWRTFGRAGTITMLIFMAGTPLLYLAQPITLAIWASGYKGLTAQHLPAGPIVQDVQLAAWTALAIAAARRHKLASAICPAAARLLGHALDRQLARPLPGHPRPFLWEKPPTPPPPPHETRGAPAPAPEQAAS